MDRLEKENSPPRRNLRRQNRGRTNLLGEQQDEQPTVASMPPSQLEGNLSVSIAAPTTSTAAAAPNTFPSFPVSPRHALPSVKRKSRREHRQSNYKSGKWTRDERLLFLKGVRAYGWGRWKEIGGTFLTTRSCVQINSHGQKVMCKIREQGMDSIMKELEDAEEEGTAPPSPEHVRRHREQYLEQRQQQQQHQGQPPVLATETAVSTTSVAFAAAQTVDAFDQEQPTLQNMLASNDEVAAAIAMCTMGSGSRSSTPSSSTSFFET